MPEPAAHPDPALQTTALRYAAADLSPAEATEFEARLAHDQAARDALGEAVRLSAAALGQEPPAPHRSFRAAIRERLAGWYPGWLARRAYRGHPAVWAGIGAVAVAACTLAGLTLAHRDPPAAPDRAATVPLTSPPIGPSAVAPAPREVVELFVSSEAAPAPDPECLSVAEMWATLSTPESVEKAHDDEMRWRQKLRDAAPPGGRGSTAAVTTPEQ